MIIKNTLYKFSIWTTFYVQPNLCPTRKTRIKEPYEHIIPYLTNSHLNEWKKGI